MVPSKRKTLVVLRTLNALEARGALTGFAGRLLTFQGGIFDITERIGVNLPGELGSVWEGVGIPDPKPQPEVKLESGDAMEGVESTDQEAKESKPKPSEPEQRRALYNTFWQLQLFFAKPSAFAEGTSAQVASVNGISASKDLTVSEVFAANKKAVDTISVVIDSTNA